MTDKVFLYARTSTDGQELGLDKQLSKMREYALDEGYSLEAEYKTHISGMKPVVAVTPESQHDFFKTPSFDLASRPTLNSIYRDAQDQNIDKLLVYNPSRLARRMRTELILEHLFDEIGVEIEYLNVSDSWIGKQVSTLINEYEVRQTRERTKDALEQKKQNDEWVGRPPTGFKTVEDHDKLVPEIWIEDGLDAIWDYKEKSKSRQKIADAYRKEVTPSRMRSLEQNMDEDKPAPKYVKGERPY